MTNELQTALVAVAQKVGSVAKDKKNDHHGYGYTSAEAVLNAVRAACVEHGVAIVGSDAHLVKYENDIATVKITQTYGKGEFQVTFSGLGSGKDKQDKAVMKASTAAIKYLLANAFNISWGDDPEATDPETGKRTSGAKRPSKGASKKVPGKPAVKDSDIAGMLSDIAAASTQEVLEAFKPGIKALKNEDQKAYTTVRDAYTARRTELES